MVTQPSYQNSTWLTLVACVHVLHALDALVLMRQVKVHDTLLHHFIATILWQQSQLLDQGLQGACRQGMVEVSVGTSMTAAQWGPLSWLQD